MTNPQKLVDDLAWCWWTQPRATRLGDHLFLGGITSGGEVVAATWDVRDGSVRKVVLAQLEPDDHNNPALVAAAGKPPLAFYSRHDGDDVIRYRVATRPDDIGEWNEERTLRFGGVTTYAQAHALGDELHLFTRVGDTRWGYVRSDDWGRSWHEPLEFLALPTDQETYMPTALLGDGHTLRVAVAGHPKNYEQRPWHEVRVCVVDLASGEVSLPSSGRVLANLRSDDGLPLRGEELEPVYAAPDGRTLNLFDVGDGKTFEVAFVSKAASDDATVDATYHVSALHDDAWHTEELVDAGTIFGYIHAGFYAGGIAFPHDTSGGCAYISREADGVWHLELWERDANGAWSSRPVFAPSRTRIVRPWPIRNPPPGLDVVALALERYDGEYMETLSHLVGGTAS